VLSPIPRAVGREAAFGRQVLAVGPQHPDHVQVAGLASPAGRQRGHVRAEQVQVIGRDVADPVDVPGVEPLGEHAQLAEPAAQR